MLRKAVLAAAAASSTTSAFVHPAAAFARRGGPALRRSLGMHAAAIEVERKFAPVSTPAELRARVEALGGELVGEVAFTDAYWDTPSCALCAADCWLRQRDGAWEFKTPVEGDDAAPSRSGGERSVFREHEGAAAAAAALSAALSAALGGAALPGGSDAALEAALGAQCGAAVFAEFGTRRTKYRLDGCNIDVDAASFGHAVVEIEVMCAAPDEVPAAEARIAGVAGKIGAEPLGKTGGKLETYLRASCPKQLAVLVAAGILPPS